MSSNPESERQVHGRIDERVAEEMERIDDEFLNGLNDSRLESGVPDDEQARDMEFIQMSGLTYRDGDQESEDTRALEEKARDQEETTSEPAEPPLSFYEKGIADVDAEMSPGNIEESVAPEADIIRTEESTSPIAELRDIIADLSRDFVEPAPAPEHEVSAEEEITETDEGELPCDVLEQEEEGDEVLPEKQDEPEAEAAPPEDIETAAVIVEDDASEEPEVGQYAQFVVGDIGPDEPEVEPATEHKETDAFEQIFEERVDVSEEDETLGDDLEGVIEEARESLEDASEVIDEAASSLQAGRLEDEAEQAPPEIIPEETYEKAEEEYAKGFSVETDEREAELPAGIIREIGEEAEEVEPEAELSDDSADSWEGAAEEEPETAEPEPEEEEEQVEGDSHAESNIDESLDEEHEQEIGTTPASWEAEDSEEADEIGAEQEQPEDEPLAEEETASLEEEAGTSPVLSPGVDDLNGAAEDRFAEVMEDDEEALGEAALVEAGYQEEDEGPETPISPDVREAEALIRELEAQPREFESEEVVLAAGPAEEPDQEDIEAESSPPEEAPADLVAAAERETTSRPQALGEGDRRVVRRRKTHKRSRRARRIIRFAVIFVVAATIFAAGGYFLWQFGRAQISTPETFLKEARQAALHEQNRVAARQYMQAADRLPAGDPRRAEALFGAAANAFAAAMQQDGTQGGLDEALSLIEEFQAEFPGHTKLARAQSMKGIIYLHLGQPRQAIEVLRDPELRLRDPGGALSVLRTLARAHFELGEYDMARRTYLQAARLEENYTPDVDYEQVALIYERLAEYTDNPETELEHKSMALQYWKHAAQVPGIGPLREMELKRRISQLESVVAEPAQAASEVEVPSPPPARVVSPGTMVNKSGEPTGVSDAPGTNENPETAETSQTPATTTLQGNEPTTGDAADGR